MDAPWGYDEWTHTEVVPKPPPLRWTIGPVSLKATVPPPTNSIAPIRTDAEDITMQLTADQQVELTVTGRDRYGNEVDIPPSAAQWASTDEAIVRVQVDPEAETATATAVAVGPVGAAVVTVSNEAGDLSGGVAVQVVAGNVTEVVVEAGEPTEKNVIDNTLPEPEGR